MTGIQLRQRRAKRRPASRSANLRLEVKQWRNSWFQESPRYGIQFNYLNKCSCSMCSRWSFVNLLPLSNKVSAARILK